MSVSGRARALVELLLLLLALYVWIFGVILPVIQAGRALAAVPSAFLLVWLCTAAGRVWIRR